MAVPHSSFHLYNEFVTLKDSIIFSSLLFYYYSPHSLPSSLSLQDPLSSLSQSIALSVCFFPQLPRLLNPFPSIQLPILFRGSRYIGPFFPSAPLTLFLCTSVRVRNSFRFALCSPVYRQMNEESTVTWKMA